MAHPKNTAAIASVLLVLACAHGAADAADSWQVQSGMASIYADNSSKTASGEKSNARSMTAAHRSLPFGTMVRVTNGRNGRSVIVRINDRGPFMRGRVIDVTPAAAEMLGFSGLTYVNLSVVAMEPSIVRPAGSADQDLRGLVYQ